MVYPSNERRYFDVNARNVDSATAKSPGHEASEFVETIVLAHERSATVALFARISENIVIDNMIRLGKFPYRHEQVKIGC